jgi:antibiotic biosynthesis monooxygenase (ABM) superfamily enzyme
MTDTLEASATAATLIIGQPVRAGRHDEYAAWHKKVESAAAHYPGYLSSEVKRPTDMQADWMSVYRFDSVAHARGWLNSATRQNLLDQAEQLFEGPATQQVIAREKQLDDALVTVVVTHRVAPEESDVFLEWHKKVVEKESKYPGFRGSEVFRPIEGLQDEWVIAYKFDTAEHLDAWLVSEDRKELLKDPRFGEFKLRKIDHSFGNWFAFGDSAQPPPSDFKSAIAVWMGLYPTVVFLTLLTAPLGMPLWLGMLAGNLLSSFVMSYFTMPYYGNPILKWWLRPSPDARQPSTNVRGLLLVLAINAAWAVVFYLVTVKLWSLP